MDIPTVTRKEQEAPAQGLGLKLFIAGKERPESARTVATYRSTNDKIVALWGIADEMLFRMMPGSGGGDFKFLRFEITQKITSKGVFKIMF